MIDKCVCKEWEGGGIAPKPAENHVVHCLYTLYTVAGGERLRPL